MVAKKEKKRPESFYQDAVKRYISKNYGCATVRELNFGGPKFDVVGFSSDSGEFHIVECKLTSRLVGIGSFSTAHPGVPLVNNLETKNHRRFQAESH